MTTRAPWPWRAMRVGPLTALAVALLGAAPAWAQSSSRNPPAPYSVTEGSLFNRGAWVNGQLPKSGDQTAPRSYGGGKMPKGSGPNRNTWNGITARGRGGRGGMGMGGFGGGHGRSAVASQVNRAVTPAQMSPAVPAGIGSLSGFSPHRR